MLETEIDTMTSSFTFIERWRCVGVHIGAGQFWSHGGFGVKPICVKVLDTEADKRFVGRRYCALSILDVYTAIFLDIDARINVRRLE